MKPLLKPLPLKNVIPLVALFFVIGNACAGTYSGGSGTSGDPYKIATTDDLIELSNTSGDWDKHFIQTADINATDTAALNSGAGFDPIGDSSTKFTGTYDGQGHAVDGLSIDRGSEDHIGLFGYTDAAEISNLELTNADIFGHREVGGLVGVNHGTVSNSTSSGSVNGSVSRVGGLVGQNGGLPPRSTTPIALAMCRVTVLSAAWWAKMAAQSAIPTAAPV